VRSHFLRSEWSKHHLLWVACCSDDTVPAFTALIADGRVVHVWRVDAATGTKEQVSRSRSQWCSRRALSPGGGHSRLGCGWIGDEGSGVTVRTVLENSMGGYGGTSSRPQSSPAVNHRLAPAGASAGDRIAGISLGCRRERPWRAPGRASPAIEVAPAPGPSALAPRRANPTRPFPAIVRADGRSCDVERHDWGAAAPRQSPAQQSGHCGNRPRGSMCVALDTQLRPRRSPGAALPAGLFAPGDPARQADSLGLTLRRLA
jgi:hypothetical protein